jgi:heme-degrading monooxygenase HmoA
LTAAASGDILALLAPAVEEEAMFARVSTYRGDTDQLVDGFRRTIAPLEDKTGFVRALFLTRQDAGAAMTITVWESEAAMSSSAEWASKAREHAAHESGATIESVATYDVALAVDKAAHR